ncbi:MAG TPA: hypothetical protein VFL97_05000 [Nitrococcus sp.]|nr:hypothetical protein [Nitrococcus sp.]
MLCYADHNNHASYRWAEQRKLETHPKTGAAQLVEVRETVREIAIPYYVEPAEQPAALKPLLFADVADEELLSYGVLGEWLADVRQANEDSLLELADHLPSEAAEALLELATGGKPQVAQPMPISTIRSSTRRAAPIPYDAQLRRAETGAGVPLRSGPSFSIRRSGRWWSGITAA